MPRRDRSVTCHDCHAAGRVCLVTVSLRSLADLPADTVTPLASCPAPGRGRGRGRGTPHFMLNTFNFPPNCPSLLLPPQLLDLVCSPGDCGHGVAEAGCAVLSGDELKASGWASSVTVTISAAG